MVLASNMAIYSAVKLSKENGCSKPHVVTSNVEHVATSNALKELQKNQNINVTEVNVDKSGLLSSEDLLSAVNCDTCLITVMLANNETGVIFPISEIACGLRKLNKARQESGLPVVLLHTDAAQAIGKIKVDVRVLDVDFLTIVGHKFYGPRVGALYVRNLGKDTLTYSVLHGGGQERGYRPGTENTPMIVGLGKAAFLVNQNLQMYQSHMKDMRDYLEERLCEVYHNIVINCHSAPRLPNTSNISFQGFPYSGAKLLESCNHTIASTTAACHSQTEPSAVLIASGVPKDLAVSAIRFSTGRNTTREDIDLVVRDIKEAIQKLLNN
ncbi:selenocysteine lyase-like isoform X2 [Lycorma delicatula]|uniref:selenocysteine lyase-like isoform X2 n=1 Tax=Lycorma delicatula TaxID=130591 RepID=UPI003F51A9D1